MRFFAGWFSAPFCIAAMLFLSACGVDPNERAATGAGIGAASGAVIGAIAGIPLTGALIGAGVGATTGALTDPSQINLGKPIWK
jgi:osmotically inducible lipoprotein OsmB